MILGGRGLNNDDVQSYLRWQQAMYNYDTILDRLTLNATGALSLEYPTRTSVSSSHNGGWTPGILNGNTDVGMTSWIYIGSSRFGSVWIGNGGAPTCACNYVGSATGIGGGSGGAKTSTCSTWVR